MRKSKFLGVFLTLAIILAAFTIPVIAEEIVDESTDAPVVGVLTNETRYFFEQVWFPEVLFEYEDEFIDLIVFGDIYEIEETIRTEWYFVSANVIAQHLMESDERYSFDNMPKLMEAIAENREELGLGEGHVVNVTLEQIDTATSAIIIEWYPTLYPLLSSFIAIAYNPDIGLHYFTLERSFDFLEDGNPPYMFCNVTVGLRRNLGPITNDKDEFIAAIGSVMPGQLQRSFLAHEKTAFRRLLDF